MRNVFLTLGAALVVFVGCKEESQIVTCYWCLPAKHQIVITHENAFKKAEIVRISDDTYEILYSECDGRADAESTGEEGRTGYSITERHKKWDRWMDIMSEDLKIPGILIYECGEFPEHIVAQTLTFTHEKTQQTDFCPQFDLYSATYTDPDVVVDAVE